MSMSRHLSPGLAMVFAALTGGCAERFFFYPDQHVYTTPQAEGVHAEEVLFAGPDGIQLHGWWLPAQGEIHGTVLHVHGNAANISNHLPLIAWLPAAGFNVLTFDYRGYGRSSGKPTIQGLVDDTRAALAWLRAARARALLDGRGFVLPDDLKALAQAALAHRLCLRDDGDAGGLVDELLRTVPVPL